MNDPNKNRSGYNETRVGWIPEEWECVKIEDIAKVRYGLTVNTQRRASARKLPYLTVANFGYYKLKLQTIKEIGCLLGDEERYALEDNDILIVEGNGSRDIVGMGVLWPGSQTPVLHQNHLIRVRVDRDVAKPSLIVEFIRSSGFRRRLQPQIITSSGLHTINSQVVAGSILPLPPLPEQQKIAEVLSTCDEVIEKTGALIDAKKRQKKSLMQQLLTGKKRLPGFAGEWTNTVLSDFCTRLKNVAKNPKGYRVLSITAGTGFVSQQEKFSRVIAGKQIEKYVVLKRGEFAYNKGNSYRYPQGCVYQLSEYADGLVPNVFYSFKLDEGQSDTKFIKQFFLASMHNKHLFRLINSGVRNNGLLNLSAADFKKTIEIPPTIEEQERISEILKTCEDEEAVLSRKLTALKQQKKALMQKLLTGQVRVKL